jgi:hypothetical protein
VYSQVEAAFRRLDLDGDGFLSWEEFQQVPFLLSPFLHLEHFQKAFLSWFVAFFSL